MPAGLRADARAFCLDFDTAYDKGALYMRELWKRVGDEVFVDALHACLEHRFQLATPQSLLHTVEDLTGRSQEDLYEQWTGGTSEQS